MKLYLASNSKRRKDILSNLNIKYVVKPSNIEEVSYEKDPGKYTMDLSKQKALAVSNTLEEGIVISADTIVYFDGKILEKPKSYEEAFKFIKMLSGKTNYAYTGVTIIDVKNNKIKSFYEKTEVIFNNITDEEINWYIENENDILDISGYSIEGKASIFISGIKGDYSNVVGLPITRLYNELKKFGYGINDFN